MNIDEFERPIRRILVALDASTHSLAALNAAAELAAKLNAELMGLFVEDENLLHFAGLPFAHEVRPSSATSRTLTSDKMEQELRLLASQARRAMELAAEKVEIRWSFRIVRGQVTSSVLAAALEADLLAMGRVSRPLLKRSKLGSTARAASTDATRSVLLMRHDSNLNYPVLVTYDGSPESRQALLAAVILARSSDADLTILVLSDNAENATSLQEEVGHFLEGEKLSTSVHWLLQPTVDALARMVHAADDCVLVLGGDNPLLKAEALQELLDKTDCPVMLTR